jgi:hypothetical protein
MRLENTAIVAPVFAGAYTHNMLGPIVLAAAFDASTLVSGSVLAGRHQGWMNETFDG